MAGRDDLALEKRRKALTREERIILGVGLGTLGYLLLPLHDVWFVFEAILLYVLLSYEFDCEPTQYRRRSWKSLSNGIEGIETSSLKVFVGSWNVGDSPPPLNAGGLSPWLTTNGKEYDIYAIGAQECHFKIPKDAQNTKEDNEDDGGEERESLMNLMEGKKGVEMVWFSALQNQLKEDFVPIGFTSCRDAIRLIVFIRKELKDFVSNVEISSTLTQIPFFYRKGGNGISFSVFNTSFCFVNTHLSAHQKQVSQRKADIDLILQNLFHSSNSFLPLPTPDVRFDHIFFFGDMNFRLDKLLAEEIETLASSQTWSRLQENDQLYKEKDSKKIFADFTEIPLSFAPTYKYKKDKTGSSEATRIYAKGRKPAWCDRILFKSAPTLSLKNLTYNCVNQITTSDHSPIFATFEAETLKFISPSSSSSSSASTSLQRFIIRFDSVEATVLPEVRRRLKRNGITTRLDYSPSFHASSPPLKSSLHHHQSSEKEEGKQQTDNTIGTWEAHELPGIQTPPSSLSVVQRHHLLVWVHIPNDFFLIDGSLVGTSLISLSELQTTTPTRFQLPLTLKTREVGTITGKIRLEEVVL